MSDQHAARLSALAELALAADRAGADVALIGGFALELWGSPRRARDVDVLIRDQEPEHARAGVTQYVSGRSSSGLLIDVILCGGPNQRLLEDTLAASVRLPGCPVPVATLPYLAALCAVAGRAQDRRDLRWIRTSNRVDPDLVEQTIARYVR